MASINNSTAQAKEKKAGKINNAAMFDVKTLIAAGINPVTGLPLKAGNISGGPRKEAVRKTLRILDEQDAVNRYKWYNLPLGMSSSDFERLIYYKGQLAFFYMEQTDEFFAMPYALDGSIDFYGRYKSIHPIPYAEGGADGEQGRIVARQRKYLSTLKLKCVYDVMEPENINEKIRTKSCVLLHDYTPQLSQVIISRQTLQDGIIDIMSDIVPFMRTALLNSTGIHTMRVNTEDEQSNVDAANYKIDQAALTGEKFIAVTGALDFQDLTAGEVSKAEEFLLALQSLDNLRLSFYGVDNGGIFEKKAHTLQSEQDMNKGNTGLVYEDGLSRRRHFCDICNSIWDLGMWCEPGDAVINGSTNSAEFNPGDNEENNMEGAEDYGRTASEPIR